MKNLVVLIFFIGLSTSVLQAQMQRQRAVKDAPIDELFLTGSIAGMSTVTNLKKGDLNSAIMHNFGLISSGIEEFWGLDQGAAVRLGVDFGISDRLSAGIGRTSIEDNVDVRFK